MLPTPIVQSSVGVNMFCDLGMGRLVITKKTSQTFENSPAIWVCAIYTSLKKLPWTFFEVTTESYSINIWYHKKIEKVLLKLFFLNTIVRPNLSPCPNRTVSVPYPTVSVSYRAVFVSCRVRTVPCSYRTVPNRVRTVPFSFFLPYQF